MSRLLEITISKAVLMLYEDELLKCLSPELYKKGFQMGKGIKRRRQFNDRVERMQEGDNDD